MKKLILVAVVVLALNGMAQEVAEVAKPENSAIIGALPSNLQNNALVVLAVNFVLAVLAIGVKQIPGKFGSIIGAVVDLFSANVKHDKK
jgi:hypothetical protein